MKQGPALGVHIFQPHQSGNLSFLGALATKYVRFAGAKLTTDGT